MLRLFRKEDIDLSRGKNVRARITLIAAVQLEDWTQKAFYERHWGDVCEAVG
jgi:hypothetical protein